MGQNVKKKGSRRLKMLLKSGHVDSMLLQYLWYRLGSGGAIVGLLLNTSNFPAMKSAFQKEGFVVAEIVPNV